MKLLFIFLILSNVTYSQVINKGFQPFETSTTNAVSVAKAATTYTAGRLYIIFSAATGALNAGSATSTTLTWTSLVSTGNSTRRINVFYCMPASTVGSETVGVSWGAAGTTGYTWAIWEITGVPTTSGGADAVLQSATGGTTGADPSITLAALTAGNTVISFFVNSVNPFAGTAESGWTEDFDDGYATPDAGSYVMSRINTSDNTPTVTASSSDWIGVAIELKGRRRSSLIN
jgi:hypothetical protein